MANLQYEVEKNISDQMLLHYGVNTEIVNHLLDKILACKNLAIAKEIAFRAKNILQCGL